MHCKYCNYPLEEYVTHEGSRDEPPTTRYECVICGPVEELKVLDVVDDVQGP